MKSSRKLWLVLILLVAVILVFVWIWAGRGRALFTDPQALTNWLQQWGVWIPLLTISLHIVQVLTAPIPGAAIDTVNGFLYGPWLGTLYSMIGLQTGGLILLLLVRHLGRPAAERFIPRERLNQFDERVERFGVAFIFLIFLIPFMPDDIVLALAGLTPLPIAELLLLALVGRLPGVFMANWLGSQAPELTTGQWVVFLFIFALLLLIFWRYHSLVVEKISQWIEEVAQRWRKKEK